MKIFAKFHFTVLAFIYVILSLCGSEAYGAVSDNRTYAERDVKKTITIAINKTSYPYHFVNQQGKAVGLMPDLWRLWAKKQHVKIQFISMSWTGTLTKVRDGSVDIHGGLSIVENRKDFLAFSKPLFSLYPNIYVNHNLTDVRKIEDLSPYAIGVVKNTAHIDALKKQYPQLKIKEFDNQTQIYEAAIKKQILAFAGLEKLSSNNPYYQQISMMYPAYKRFNFKEGEYAVAVAKNNKALLQFVEEGLAKISAKEKANIERKWLGVDKSRDNLIIAFSPNYSPYSSLSLSGQPQGLLIDAWRLWSKQTDTKISFLARSIEESLILLEKGEVDVLFAWPDELVDHERFSSTNILYKSPVQFYLRKNIANVHSIADINKNKKIHIGFRHNSPFAKQLKADLNDDTFIEYASYSELLRAFELRNIDGFVAQADLIEMEIMSANLPFVFNRFDLQEFTLSLAPVVKKDNKLLATMINEGFERIKLKELIKIEERWLRGDTHYYKNQLKHIVLTEKEKNFISIAEPLKVGFLNSLKPAQFINQHGQFVGIDRDYLDLIAKRTSLNFKYIGFDSWSSLYKSMVDGQLDLVSSITETASRSEKLLFSKPYIKTPWTILHPQYLGRQTGLKSFYGKKLAIVKGYYLIDYLREKHPLIILETVENREKGLLALQQGKVDGVVETISSASFLLKQESLVNLMISVMEGVKNDQSSFAVNKDNLILKHIIDKGIDSISREEKNTIHDKWYSIDITTGLDKSVVLRVALQAAFFILIVLIIILIWNRRLQKEIKQRKQLEKNMKHMATHDALTGLANRVLLKDRINNAIEFHQRQNLMLAVLFLDLDGFKQVNDEFGHNIGDELLLIVAKRLQSCVRKSDTVVRFGGDEFVLLLTGIHAENEPAYVAEKVLELIQQPFELSAATVQIGCSIGISLYPSDGMNEIELLKKADALMYKVKANGKNNYLTSHISKQ